MDYIEYGRSNYFKIKPGKEMALRQVCQFYGLNLSRSNNNNEYVITISQDETTMRSTVFVDNGEDFLELKRLKVIHPKSEETECIADDIYLLPFQKVIKHYLSDQSVFIWMSVGYEGLKYLVGTSWAVNSKGLYKSVSLEDIYKKAEKLRRINPKVKDGLYVDNVISRCEY